MGFLYCPNCGKGVSVQAKISACPNCCHPFTAVVWRRIENEKIAKEAERVRKKEEEEREKERQINVAENSNKCPLCGKLISWEEIKRPHGIWGGVTRYRHPTCNACGWSSFLAFEEEKKEHVIGYKTYSDDSDYYPVSWDAPITEDYWEKTGTVSWKNILERGY